MSLILEALRKMEQERSRKRGAQVDIRPEVLRYRGNAAPQPRRSYLPVVAGVVLLGVGLGAGVLLKGQRAGAGREAALERPVERAAETAAGAQGTQRTSTTQGTQTTETGSGSLGNAGNAGSAGSAGNAENAGNAGNAATAVASDARVPKPGRAGLREAARAALPAHAGTATVAPVTQPVAVTPRLRQPASREIQVKPAQHESAAPLQPAPSDISLSGIAWQDERSLRRAVLNGSLVGEGAEVAGARVLEIREDKVRLSRGGQNFEVVLSGGR